MAEVWSYGITTVPQRVTTLLPPTLKSLARAGFDCPHLFVDGLVKAVDGAASITQREQPVGAFGNWILAAWELYVKEPQARLYAICQDDILMCRGVKEYVERCDFPKMGYLNLFTFASNEIIISTKEKGWCKSDQLGRGAVALVFSHPTLITLLQQSHMVNKPQLPKGNMSIDGAIQHALVRQAGIVEYIHNPSLVQHTGCVSVIGNHRHPEAKTFPGESFDITKAVI